MAQVLGVGIAALDIILSCDTFPAEDSEMRAQHLQLCRGGNVCNSLVVLSQLGEMCSWAGTLADDENSHIISHDLHLHNIDTRQAVIIPSSSSPTSYIVLNQQNASRTIVHYRDIREYQYKDFQNIDLAPFDWIHFEGRNVEETKKMMQRVNSSFPHIRYSVELEKLRDNIEQLLYGAAIIFFSRQFAIKRGFSSADEFLRHMRKQNYNETPILLCPWGERGAYALDQHGQIHHATADQQHKIIDTIGAGDTFNAAFLHAHLAQQDIATALQFATTVASKKCQQLGFSGLAQHSLTQSSNTTIGLRHE